MSTEIINDYPSQKNDSNRILIKGLITGLLILVMLIPTLFVSNLVKEREERQQQIVQEVSSKWASAQQVSGPYLSVPYVTVTTDTSGKQIVSKSNLVIIPETTTTEGKIIPQPKQRSIYKVMVYKSDINTSGRFNIVLPEDIKPEFIDFAKAKICVGISDYKGLEEMIAVRFNGSVYNLSPGLPTNQVDDTGFSSPVPLSITDLSKPLLFDTRIKIKGSNALHFLPLSANSKYKLSSSWSSPSFDGATLPDSPDVKESGFNANWTFNQANLPFAMVTTDQSIKNSNTGFGVNLIQPADQYAKTMRSVKYAILFIGLTFALFFIVELMQQRPFHPVQYILVGIALVIFYTLLLSISEFVSFDIAYIIAALATILLITLYAKGHFNSWKIASVFAAVLAALYGFIFILIRLEDTALLVGSIGLFIVLALVMYASRKVNWYGHHGNPVLSE